MSETTIDIIKFTAVLDDGRKITRRVSVDLIKSHSSFWTYIIDNSIPHPQLVDESIIVDIQQRKLFHDLFDLLETNEIPSHQHTSANGTIAFLLSLAEAAELVNLNGLQSRIAFFVDKALATGVEELESCLFVNALQLQETNVVRQHLFAAVLSSFLAHSGPTYEKWAFRHFFEINTNFRAAIMLAFRDQLTEGSLPTFRPTNPDTPVRSIEDSDDEEQLGAYREVEIERESFKDRPEPWIGSVIEEAQTDDTSESRATSDSSDFYDDGDGDSNYYEGGHGNNECGNDHESDSACEAQGDGRWTPTSPNRYNASAYREQRSPEYASTSSKYYNDGPPEPPRFRFLSTPEFREPSEDLDADPNPHDPMNLPRSIALTWDLSPQSDRYAQRPSPYPLPQSRGQGRPTILKGRSSTSSGSRGHSRSRSIRSRTRTRTNPRDEHYPSV